MNLEMINKNIERLLAWRRCVEDYELWNKITLQLAKLYDFKNEILMEAENV